MDRIDKLLICMKDKVDDLNTIGVAILELDENNKPTLTLSTARGLKKVNYSSYEEAEQALYEKSGYNEDTVLIIDDISPMVVAGDHRELQEGGTYEWVKND